MALWPSYNSMKMMVGMMVVVLVGIHQVSEMVQDLGLPKSVDSLVHHSNKIVRRLKERHNNADNDNDDVGDESTNGKTRVATRELIIKEHEHGGLLIEDVISQRLEAIQANSLHSRQEIEQMRGRVMELEQELHMFKYHLSESVEFRPLKAPEFKHLEQGERFDGHTYHYFMSEFKGRGMKQGPPEFFCFPSLPSSSDGAPSSTGLASSCYRTNILQASFASSLSSSSSLVSHLNLNGNYLSSNLSNIPQTTSSSSQTLFPPADAWQVNNTLEEPSTPSSCDREDIRRPKPSMLSSSCHGSNIVQPKHLSISSPYHGSHILQPLPSTSAFTHPVSQNSSSMNRNAYLSSQKLLCLRGNHTTDGLQNSYAFAFQHGLPQGSRLVTGTTLISDTVFDFSNPWHSMYNLLQFVYWRLESRCSRAAHLLLFHKGEYRSRAQMGSWIAHILNSSGVPTSTLPLQSPAAGPLCFEHAVVSRSGIGGMTQPLLRRMYAEARCHAKLTCNLDTAHNRNSQPVSVSTDFAGSAVHPSTPPSAHHHLPRHAHVTLMLRRGGRRFIDEHSWQRVVEEQCKASRHCTWSTMHVANLTFCQQVEVMSHTDILISAHGGQLTNMIFMSPGGRVMEMFPGGWLELAGRGQFIYRSLASWIGLQHEGYWRDPSTTPCPTPGDVKACRSYYKDQAIGINTTHIGNWLREVIDNFQNAPLFNKYALHQSMENPSKSTTCECNV